MRRLLASWAIALPLAASAQGFQLRAPSLGEALDTMQRLEERSRKDGYDRAGLAQTYVVPERPGQNQVSWFDFHWRYYDIPAPGGGKGGIRLYYYDTARQQARLALPAIRSAYARLVDQFHYSPTKRIPYILYATQREFQTTNVFAVTESVLGVTSPEDLKMTVPYFGDHARFVEVSTHEMVHQFTIQKLLEASGSDALSSPIQYLPLWFIEGIAEYYTKGGIDVETDLYLRDLVWNPDPRRGYEVLPFAEDRLRGYIPTYKLGQARIAFIAETYGPEKIQQFLESAYLLGDASNVSGQGSSGPPGQAPRGFAALVRRVLGEPLEQVDERWKTWLKRRYYAEYLRATQTIAQLREVRGLPAEPESFAVSPDGSLVLYRGIDREKGRARIYLFESARPRSAHVLASDNQPGFESLHPVEYGVVGIGNGVLGFSASDGPGDTLYVQRYRRKAKKDGKPGPVELGQLRRLEVEPPQGGHFIQIADPTFSPDGSEVAFVGLARDGQQDVYIAPVTGGKARRLTDDPYAEKDLAWGKDGIYLASDATDHARLNLFRIDPATGSRTRLTTAAATDRGPRPLDDGSVAYSSDAGGKPDLYILKDGQTRRITDFATGLVSPAVAPTGHGLWAGTFQGGTFRMLEVAKASWLDLPSTVVSPPAGDVLPIPTATLPEDPRSYQPLALRNWSPAGGFVYGGGTTGAFAGRAAVLFTDYLRDHLLFIDLQVLGSWDFTQAIVLYDDRSKRLGWSTGAYHFVQEQLDTVDPNLTYYQRDFGLVGALRYPLDRFRRVEADFTVGAIQRYCLTDFSGLVIQFCDGIQNPASPYGPGDPNDPATPIIANHNWKELNGGTNLTLTSSIRFGYDTIRYDIATGPLTGGSFMAELGGIYLPTRSAVSGFFRTDMSRFWQIIGRTNFMLRLAGGTSFSPGGESSAWERSWWLIAADNLRGYQPGDWEFLRGRHYYVANAELQIPLNPFIRLFIFDYVEGVAALDFGGVFNQYESVGDPNRTPGAWEARTLTGVLGVNVLFGPLLLRVHFGHPYDIGGILTPAMRFGDKWVTNVTLRYFFW